MMVIGFLIDYFKSKGLDYLLDHTDNIHSSLLRVFKTLQSRYVKGDIVGDDEIRRHHFVADVIFEQGVAKMSFDENYSNADLERELLQSNRIIDFSTQELDSVVQEFYDLCKSEPELSRWFIYKEIKTIKRDLNSIINPNLIITPQQFINESSHPSLAFSIPLNNVFYGRTDELNEGLKSLSIDDILVIEGVSGAGKTKFAIELCSRFVEQEPEYVFVCLKGMCIQDAYSAFNKLIEEKKKVIILVDDANRVSGNYQSILLLLTTYDPGSVKIVVTVRDYAAQNIYEKSRGYKYLTLRIDNFKDEDIVSVLNSESFNINNYHYTKKITRIAKGNIRIAIMCAMIANKQQDLDALDNVYDVFEAYYGPIYDDLISKQNVDTLKVLGVMSFFRAVSRDNKTLGSQIYDICNISEETFWDICKFLESAELVELWESDVVKMSDQTMMTYIAYRTFFKEKLISYSEALKRFIDYKEKIVDVLYSIINSFGYDRVMDDVKCAVLAVWDDSDYEKSFDLCKTFYPFIPLKTLSILNKHIDSMPIVECEYLYESDDYVYGDSSHELSLLSNIGTTLLSHTETSLVLMFRYVQKSPIKASLMIGLFKDRWGIRTDSSLIGYYLQNKLVDYLKDHCSEDVKLYSNIIIRVIPEILKTDIHHVSVEGNKLCTESGNLYLTPNLETLRQKCWDALLGLTDEYVVEIGKILLSNEIYYNKEHDDILNFDLPFIIKWVETRLDKDNFIHCYIVHKYFRTPKKLCTASEIVKNFHCREWEMYSKFNYKDKVRSSLEESIKERFKIYADYCRTFQFDDYLSLVKDIRHIIEVEKYFGVTTSDYINNILFAGAYGNNIKIFERLFIELLCLCPEDIHLYRIYGYICDPAAGIENVILDIRERVEEPWKSQVLAHIYSSISKERVTKRYAIEAMRFLRDSDLAGVCIHSGLIDQCIDRYSNITPANNIWQYLLSTISDKIDQGQVLKFEDGFFEGRLNSETNPELIFKVLIHSKQNIHSSHVHNAMKYLLGKDVVYLIRYIDIVYKDVYINEHNSDFNYIWEMDNVVEIMDAYRKYLQTKEYRGILFSRDMSVMFGGDHTDKQIAYLKQKLSDDVVSNAEFVFDVASDSLWGYIPELIGSLLTLTTDIEIFKKICIHRRSHSWVGSEIPVHQGELNILVQIKEVIEKLTPQIDYLEHLEYIGSRIDSKQAYIDEIRKKEFYSE